MVHKVILLFFLLNFASAKAEFSLQKLTAKRSEVQMDLKLILKEANLDENLFTINRSYSKDNLISIKCSESRVELKIASTEFEWNSTLYYGLQKLGFLFPHPRMQISPKKHEIKKHCGRTYKWRPALKYRGFHLHTLHAGEWLDGFLMGRTKIAKDLIRWLARNNQNIFDLSLVRMKNKKIFNYLSPLFQFARDLGIHPGVTFGIAFHQQNSYKLVSLWAALFDGASKKQITKNLTKMLDNLPLSFINVEMGTSEFTPVNYERMLSWLNLVGEISQSKNVQMMTKIHTSTNQNNKKYGNFNFLPQFASKNVGILPHTVFYHGLNDSHAPLYGNKNFSHMRDFMLQEKDKRMTWFYPETSYYIGLDIDAPLFLLEYLRTRAQDMKFLHQNNINGVLNFSTGQENGYWLMDWSQTLYNNLDYKFSPQIALKLLGEDLKHWKELADIQRKYFTDRGLISILTFSNFGEELFPKHKILQRNLLKELKEDPKKLEIEIGELKSYMMSEFFISFKPKDEALLNQHNELKKAAKNSSIPTNEMRSYLKKRIYSLEKNGTHPYSEIKNYELLLLLEITNLRVQHAFYVRYALKEKKNSKERKKYLTSAKNVRQSAMKLMKEIMKNFNRYPDSFVYQKRKNPSAYPYGYGYASSTLHYWEREEEMVRQDNFNPLFMNIWDFIDIIL